jgi:hypothetical protein
VAGQGEFDIHSNSIDGSVRVDTSNPVLSGCTSSGVEYGGANLTGVFRNNIMQPGPCWANRFGFSAYAFREATSPRILEHNALLGVYDPGDLPVYLDGAGPLFIDEVNELTDTMASGNAEYASRNTGTVIGAPRRDFNGKLRDATPDIGAIEQ